MADSESGPLDGMREVFSRILERMDTRETVVRLDERVKQTATREEMNAADSRTLEAVSSMFDRSTAASQTYVREQIAGSNQATKSLLLEFEKHLFERFDGVIARVADAAAKAAVAAMPAPQREDNDRRNMHPVIPWVGGPGIGGLLVYLILAFLGYAPRPGG
jgi:hypothetical protein